MYEAKLYKVDSKGKVRFWKIKTFQDQSFHHGKPWGYTISHGIEGSPNIVSSTTYVTPKNVGKKNETTPEQQADLEAESLVKKQVDKNYTFSLDQAQNEDVGLLPMLAQSYKDHAAKIVFPCYIQPKLDGIRCLAVIRDGDIVLISRKGKEFNAITHLKEKIAESIGYTIKTIPDDLTLILDGELYSHDMTFQEIISATKRDTANDKSAKIHYNIYDIVLDADYEDRLKAIERLITENDNVKKVETHLANEPSDVFDFNVLNLTSGYEGSILRNLKGSYETDKRSYNLQKVKTFLDAEFKIVGAEQNKGKQGNQCCFICETDHGATFKVKPVGSDAERAEYWTNHKDYIGKYLTVKFFEWSTSNPPVPRFGVGLRIRDYE